MQGAPGGSWAQLRQMCSSRCGVSSLWLLLWEILLGAVAQEPSESVCCCCQERTRTRSGEPQGSGAEGALKASTENCQLSLPQSAWRLWFSCHWMRDHAAFELLLSPGCSTFCAFRSTHGTPLACHRRTRWAIKQRLCKPRACKKS